MQLVTTSIFLLITLTLFAQDSGEQLREAARVGDAKKVQSLLEQGADVDAQSRYGVTALSFAADRGHEEIVKILLDKGADVELADTFYQMTPVARALFNGNREIALILLHHGADPTQALFFGVRENDAALVRAALAQNRIPPDQLRSALSQVEQGKTSAEILELLESLDIPEEETEAIEVSAETLRRYIGKFQNEALSAEVKLEEEGLVLEAAGQPPLHLVALTENSFKAAEFPQLKVSFVGRGGMIERMIVEQDNSSFVFLPATETSEEPVEESELLDAPTVTTYPRKAPQSWPSFRGTNASGVADGQGVPTKWNLKTGKNVLWKTPIGGIANSSPIIHGDYVFITTAISSAQDKTFRTGLYGDVKPVDDLSEHTWKVIALDRKTGQVRWEKVAFQGTPRVKRHFKASQANSSPATDGRRVVALFGSVGLLVCYDMDGNLMWEKNIGVLDSGWFYDPSYQWGHSSSPVIYGGKVIVQADVQKDSFLAAYDLATGHEVWKTSRDEIPTWGTPTIVEGDVTEIVTNGTTIRSYDVQTGKLLWELGPNSEVTVATPVVGEELVYVTAGYPPVRPIYAVRPGSRGDLTLPEGEDSSKSVPWSYKRGGTYIPTPIYYDGYLYTLANNGRMTCYDAATGEEIYRQRVGNGDSFSASPVASDGRLFFTSETGDVFVVKAGPRFELLATNQMDGVCMATPAISDGVMVIRTLEDVYGIGPTPQQEN